MDKVCGGTRRVSCLDFILKNGSFEIRRGSVLGTEFPGAEEFINFVRCGVLYIRACGGTGNVIVLPREFEAAAVNIKTEDAYVKLCSLDALDVSLKISGGMFRSGVIKARSIYADLGRGTANITAKPELSSFFECGMGDMHVRFLGNREDHRIRSEHGVGELFIDGEKTGRKAINGIGSKEIFARCGMGVLRLDFAGMER